MPGTRCTQSKAVCTSHAVNAPPGGHDDADLSRVGPGRESPTSETGQHRQHEDGQQQRAHETELGQGLEPEAVGLAHILVCAPFEEVGPVVVARSHSLQRIV